MRYYHKDKKVISVECILMMIKNYRRIASRKYNESRSKPIHSGIDDAYYNGKMRVLDQLKINIKKTLK